MTLPSETSPDAPDLSHRLYEFAARLFPICRSLTGEGVRVTLRLIQEILPELQIMEIPSGTQCFDWTIPPEWNIRDAYVLDECGNKVIDFRRNNLHVVGYSIPVQTSVTLEELDEHLYSLPEQPTAIPYITSYYSPRWGFCLAHQERQRLKPGTYRVVIDSTLEPGVLNYGELILPGREPGEVLLSTYICHPSMANNEVSGPVVTTFLARWLSEMTDRRYTYRVVYIPETIGAIAYLSRNLEPMKRNTVAGFVVTCVGDDRCYSYLPSRRGGTLADKVALHVLKSHAPDFHRYPFLERGSDERQYCSVGVDLPVASLMRSKYATYPEYHTSLDDLNLISPQGLVGAFQLLQKCITAIERNRKYRVSCPCEPQLGKRGLYPTLSTKTSGREVRTMMNILAYADGEFDLIDIAETIGVPVEECYPIVERLVDARLLDLVQTGVPDRFNRMGSP
jgi:aminopeptidase-like protein